MKSSGMGSRMVTVVLSLTLLAATAYAAAYFHAANPKWTKVSGEKGSQKLTWQPASTDYGVFGFGFEEKGDDPIVARAFTQKLCSANCESGEGKVLKFRDPKGLPQIWSVRMAKDHFVTAIQVCTNNKKDEKKKIKGLRAWGARIGANGKLVKDTTKYEDKLNNCKKWHSKVSCPSGRIATGFKVHYNSDKVGFSGMALSCSQYKKK